MWLDSKTVESWAVENGTPPGRCPLRPKQDSFHLGRDQVPSCEKIGFVRENKSLIERVEGCALSRVILSPSMLSRSADHHFLLGWGFVR